MRPFVTIAIPHRDVLEGRLAMDVFAADLWKVVKGEAPVEYQNSDSFFRRTFITKGLENILKVVEGRLIGKGGDSVIQLQTPFGGGKTHTLIALYHKAREWGAKVVAIDGTVLDPKETTLWEEMERQITGEISLLKGKTSPGREKLEDLISQYQPFLILIDEVLEYTTKSAGIKVGDSNLASQTLAFMQELTVAISSLDKSLLILKLPSSALEHYDENAERIFQQLQKITGRVEKIYTPVEDEEVAQVIRKRLFSSIDEKTAKENVEKFLDYAEREGILPVDRALYRERFLKSFPFQPEVIDVLYKRWGSFPTFQRTRGVLRILALVVHTLKGSQIPFIRLADFKLENEELRRELIKHIGQEYDSIVYADITSPDSGSKRVDRGLGNAYLPYSFGTKISTTIFMYSFSGGLERGANFNELKLSCSDIDFPSTVITEAIEKLKENLFYLSDSGLFFTNQPNLNRILLNKMENIDLRQVKEEEVDLLRKALKNDHFKLYIWPKITKDVPDTFELKLIVLENKDKAKEFIENCGDRPRVYRNVLIFLCPSDSERVGFETFLKRKLAWLLIEGDKTLQLTEAQKKEVKDRIKKTEDEEIYSLRTLYRIVLLTSKDGLKEIDLGIPVHQKDLKIDKEIYERLRSEGEILEKVSALIIKEKYLKDKDYVVTKNLLDAFYKTPGEIRIIKEEVLKMAIKDGVKQGQFGLGRLENGNPVCHSFKEDCETELEEGEIIIQESLCKVEKIELFYEAALKPQVEPNVEPSVKSPSEAEEDKMEAINKREKYGKIRLQLKVPHGKFYGLTGIVNFIKSKFSQMETKIEIIACEGEITPSEYEDKIKEALNQAEISIEDENFE